LRRLAPLCLAFLLGACPEERPDTRRPVPAARVPPAVPVESPAPGHPPEPEAPPPARGATSGR